MPNIDLLEEKILIINKNDYYDLFSIMQPQTYHRLYRELEEIEKEYNIKISRIMTHQKEHFPDKLKHLIQMDKLRDELIKNQCALGMIFERLIYAKYDANNNKVVILNLFLLYEMYISLANRIETYETLIQNYTEEQYKADVNKYIKNKNSFKRTIDKIFVTIGLEDLSKIELEYKTLNTKKYIDICYSKKDA